MRIALLTAAAAAAMTLAANASAAGQRSQQEQMQARMQSLRLTIGTAKRLIAREQQALDLHQRWVWVGPSVSILVKPIDVERVKAKLARLHRVLDRATKRHARLRVAYLASLLPAHYQLWMCIHPREASDWHNRDTGGNGHYGGLQMHPGWGRGTSYYASDDSPLVQMMAAERGYAESGYSRSWLLGQWGQTVGPCLGYA